MLRFEFDWSSSELHPVAERGRALTLSRWAVVGVFIRFAVVVAGGGLGAWIGAGRSVGWDSALIGYSAAGAVIGLILSYITATTLNGWLCRGSRLPTWKGRIIWTLAEDSLAISQEGYEIVCKWERVDAVILTDGEILVAIAGQFFILPERAFQTSADTQAVWEFIWQRLNSEAQELSDRLQASDEFLGFKS